MKKYLFFIVVISLISIQCSEDTNPINIEDDGSLVVVGKINNFSGNFNKIYTTCFPKSDSLQIESIIQSDGSFNIKIPTPLENQLLYYTRYSSVTVNNGDSTIFYDSTNIVDNNLKYIRYDLYAQSSSGITYSLPLNLAKLTMIGEYAKVGDYFISHYYFDTKTKIQGYYKWRVTANDTSYEAITNFNINTKIGWNMVITKFVSESNNKSFFEVTDINIEEGDWIIGAIHSFKNAERRF
jgi:hypothetical protein